MKNKILFVVCLLFGLMFINAGLNKFFNYIPVPEDMPEQAMEMFMAMMKITWLMPLIATFEIIGGALIMLPRFRALGAIVITPTMIGILVHHFALGIGLIMPLSLFCILTWIIVESKDRYLPLVQIKNTSPTLSPESND
ncbi:MAG: DoxX family protein [Cyclobacteriaceae bacterium]